MRDDDSTTRFDELLALAVLGELSAAEERELDEILRDEPARAAELAADAETAAALQRTIAVSPPSALRAEVLAAISATPQLPATEPAVSGRVVPLAPRLRRLAPLLAAAAAFVLLGGGVVLVANQGSDPDPVAAVVDADDAVTRPLTGDLGALAVVYSAAEDALVVTGTGVAALDDDQTYQLWFVSDAAPTSVGTFQPASDGTVGERFDDVDPTGVVVAVTREPAGGSATPTLPILASA